MEKELIEIREKISLLYSSLLLKREKKEKSRTVIHNKIKRLEKEFERLKIEKIKKTLRKPAEDFPVVCYLCRKSKGIAKEILRSSSKVKKDKNGKAMKNQENKNIMENKWGWVWHAKGFKMVNLKDWLCHDCDMNRRCRQGKKGCHILLSNDLICSNCGLKHGAFYPKHPHYCKVCWDKRTNKKHDIKR